jgi:hypothetical protein
MSLAEKECVMFCWLSTILVPRDLVYYRYISVLFSNYLASIFNEPVLQGFATFHSPSATPHVLCFVLARILSVLYFVRSTVTESVLWSSSKLGNYTLSGVSSWLLNKFAAVPCDWNPLAPSEPETRCIAVVTAALLWRLRRFVVFCCNMTVSQVCPDLRLETAHLGVSIP